MKSMLLLLGLILIRSIACFDSADAVSDFLIINLVEGSGRTEHGRRTLESTVVVGSFNDLDTIQNITIKHSRHYRRMNKNDEYELFIDTTKYIKYVLNKGPSNIHGDETDIIAWHGVAAEGLGFATFIKKGQLLSAFLTTQEETYSLIMDKNGSHVAHATNWKDYVSGNPRRITEQADGNSDNEDHRKRVQKLEVDPFSWQNWEEMCKGRRRRSLQGLREIHVLVVLTSEAACGMAIQKRDCTSPDEDHVRLKLEEALETANLALLCIDVPFLIKIVRVEITTLFQGMSMLEAFSAMKEDQTVKLWTEESYSDLEMLIVDRQASFMNTNGFLEEWAGDADEGEEYSVANNNSLPYQFAHNFGRNIGCRPQAYQLPFADLTAPHEFNYAYEYYVDGEISYYRTIMGLDCHERTNEQGCVIIPFFSTKYHNHLFNGKSVTLGGAFNDNASYIELEGERTASRRDPFATNITTSFGD